MSKALQLPSAAKTGISMQANGTHVDLYLFGVIGDWWDGNTANEVLQQLRDAQDVESITVKLSTIGGYFEDGLPIYNLLRQHPAHVTVEVMGYALSMGSVIMLAGDTIRMAQNALAMIHNAQGVAWGSPADMRKAADMLAKHEQAILPRYMERMGKTAAAVQMMLDEETWFTADEALAAGLIDAVIDPVDLSAIDKRQPENAWHFAAKNFKHPPTAFVERVGNAASRNRPWVERILNRVVGTPPAITPPVEPEYVEDDMTPEDLQAALKAEREEYARMLDEKLAALKPAEPAPEPSKPAEEAPEMKALREQAEALAAQNTALAAELAELKKEVPSNIPPVNNAPAGDAKYDY
ncbi:head maturation protease, ClpP-related [Candidatus Thiothrix sp. Deng01]|uniref:ATP-dependent Clp protease proteolytic subunit n=1 Tax=Candidatus Thiothrix phosphatis TaxID=3112415 RepID=A0ABU6CXX0_9GAMM|nr:head maturation protease, ClpP-related [Candidatus Thiothrix sp. Deng01]MEB4591392.1 head maturation protease, ClpP-related [Candidatus Thiothrix sp. Deng01]